MLSRIYYAVATSALVATMDVLEGAQHAQSLKFRMNQGPQNQNYVLKVQSNSTQRSCDVEISVTRKEKILVGHAYAEWSDTLMLTKIPIYHMYYYGTYITEEFLGRKFLPNQKSFPGESLVAIQNDSGLAVMSLVELGESLVASSERLALAVQVAPYSINLFTVDEGDVAMIGYTNLSIIPSESEKAFFAATEKKSQEVKFLCESLQGQSTNEIRDACA